MTEAIYSLPDFRKLSYAIYGPPDGKPVLYFHGTPSSRLEPLILETYGVNLDRLLERSNLKLIAIDRPGMGFSTFNATGDFLSFAHDTKNLAEHLRISSCPVLCWSGGGPYALAMAHQFPQFIPSVHIICGFAKKFDSEVIRQMGLNKWYFLFSRSLPFVVRLTMKFLRYQKIFNSVPQKLTGLPHEDFVFLEDPVKLDKLATYSMKQACRLGSTGPVHEARSYFSQFDFDLSGIRSTVHYWWGTRDQTVIKLHPEEIEIKIPNHVMHYRDGEGHLSLYVNCFEEVLQTISAHYQ